MKIPKSTWEDGIKIPKFPALKESKEREEGDNPEDSGFDVAIIGGGLTGIVTAYLLSQSGKKVAVFEKDKIGFGATGLTTAFLTKLIDTDFRELAEIYDKGTAKLVAESHGQAIDMIERIVKEHKIDCEFMRVSNFVYANDEKEALELRGEEKTDQDLGLDIKFRDAKFGAKLGFPNMGFLELKNQAKFHPLKYLFTLAEIAQSQGAQIFENTEIKEIRGRSNDSGPYILKNSRGTVRANKIFVATYAPLGKKLFFKKAFYDTYVFELETTPGVLKPGIYEDNMNPYHYFRVDRLSDNDHGMDMDRIIIGGEDHRSDVHVSPQKSWRALESYVHEKFPGLKYKIVRRWRGPIIESVDGLAYIGPHKDPNIFYATAFSGNGMTYAHIAATIVRDLVLGKKNPFSKIYDANRKPTLKQLAAKGRDYSEEFIHGALKNTFKYKK